MKERIAYSKVYNLQPVLAKTLMELGDTAAKNIDHSIIHLVKLRASQINGCAFCQHMHANEARKDGEQQSRLDVLPAWKEVPVFSDRERAALAWTEKLTLVANHEIHDEDFALVREQFSEEEIVNLTAAIVTINAWNRIAVGFHFIPNIK
ncbi:MAG: carboxymuconolactone decarboxylase family protein [Cellvibrio sp.]|uniref:carboxymuconolactone decarboxylase family protein n=1 Tax=Cellvibrio sp. TaxID=1965322 RepID=UPI0031B1E659